MEDVEQEDIVVVVEEEEIDPEITTDGAMIMTEETMIVGRQIHAVVGGTIEETGAEVEVVT